MGLGFGKVKAKKDEALIVESMVRASNLEPAVVLKWGSYEGIMTPDEAIAHAMSVLEAASAARSDAAVTKLFSTLEGLDLPKAALFRRYVRDFRRENAGQDFSGIRMVLDPDAEPVPIEEVKQNCHMLLAAAMLTETEVFLVEYLRTKMEMDETRINGVIGELRDIMYPPQTVWEEESNA